MLMISLYEYCLCWGSGVLTPFVVNIVNNSAFIWNRIKKVERTVT